ncbi:MAG: hypothetical protein AAF594_16060 [Bacteroidota bacterium]
MRLLSALALLLALAAAPASGQVEARLNPTAPRVLFAASDSVKTDDGSYARIATVVRYDPEAGTYEHTLQDASGAVLSRSVREMTVVGPTAGEEAEAQALVAEHAELARVMAGAEHPVLVRGGFPLVRESGTCGPGSRCLLYDVLEVVPDSRVPRRLRYVVVDLRTLRVADADADPVVDGNLAHPAARRQSRSF